MSCASEPRQICSPIRLAPKQQPVVWGGSQLHTLLGKPAATEHIGESWEVWEGDPVVAGPLSGVTLKEAVDRYALEILGSVPLGLSGKRFPLLTKFIDAHEALSVQVHPDDTAAQKLESQPNGKTEAWYILAASNDAWIIHGLNEAVDAESFRTALESGTVDALLRKVKPAPGETIFVPAGTIHAIGPGVLLHEIQQTSDITYRLYDWSRKKSGTDEPARELHLDQGLLVSSLKPSPSPAVKPVKWAEGSVTVKLLLASRYFTVKQVIFPGDLTLDTQGTSFHILTAVDGSVSVATPAEILHLPKGQSILLPACLRSYTLSSDERACLLVEYISEVRAELVPEMQSHGLTAEKIEDFLAQFAPLSMTFT